MFTGWELDDSLEIYRYVDQMGIVKSVGTHPNVLQIEIRHTQISGTYPITGRWELT
jgi:hypothetical protein